MDARDIQKAADSSKRLIQDEYYYKYIFKKTERVVSVVFYILNSVPENKKSLSHIEDIQHSARSLHDAILQSLETRAYAAEDVVRAVAHALITLESKLSVAQVAGVFSVSVLEVFHSEIDNLLRSMNRYLSSEPEDLFFAEAVKREPVVARGNMGVSPLTQSPSSHREKTTPASPTQADRKERIKVILEAKGEASIKDISDIISDVSEKTIQRELNAMIEEGVLKRQGERRWSKYSIA